jgi:GAF domain-containing protein
MLVLFLLMGYLATIEKGGVARSSPPVYLGLCLALALSAVQLALGYRFRVRSAPHASRPVPAGRLSEKPLDYLISLLNVSRAVSRRAQLPDLYQVIVEACRDCFECDEVSLMLIDPSGTELGVVAFAGHRDASRVRDAKVRLGEGVAGKVAMDRVPLILGPEVDPRQFLGFQQKARRIESSMVAPIVVGDQVVGVLNASSGEKGYQYGETDLRVLCLFAEHAGIVTERARDLEVANHLVDRLRLQAGDAKHDPHRKAA